MVSRENWLTEVMRPTRMETIQRRIGTDGFRPRIPYDNDTLITPEDCYDLVEFWMSCWPDELPEDCTIDEGIQAYLDACELVDRQPMRGEWVDVLIFNRQLLVSSF